MKKSLLILAIVFLFATKAFAVVGAGTVTVAGTCVELSGAEADYITVRCPTNGTESGVVTGTYTKGDETNFKVTFKHSFLATPVFASANTQMDPNASTAAFEAKYFYFIPANYAAVQPFEFKVYHPVGAKYIYITFTPTGGTPTGTFTGVSLNNQ